jgi:hypothetical protein
MAKQIPNSIQIPQRDRKTNKKSNKQKQIENTKLSHPLVQF